MKTLITVAAGLILFASCKDDTRNVVRGAYVLNTQQPIVLLMTEQQNSDYKKGDTVTINLYDQRIDANGSCIAIVTSDIYSHSK